MPEMWQDKGDSEQSNWDASDELGHLNDVSIKVASSVIPKVRKQAANRVTPSAESIEFSSQRAREIANGVTPSREKELHRKMGRHRRRDYRRWLSRSVSKMDECIVQCRWREARRWSDTIRGVPRQARTMPTVGYRNRVVIRTDEEAAFHINQYMRDLFARTLADRARYGEDWPKIQGDPNGPGSKFNDILFQWACGRAGLQASTTYKLNCINIPSG